MRSIRKHLSTIVSQSKVYTERFLEEIAEQRTAPNIIMAALEASVHSAQNRPLIHFAVYSTNESCCSDLLSFAPQCLALV